MDALRWVLLRLRNGHALARHGSISFYPVLSLALTAALLFAGCDSREGYKRRIEQTGLPYTAESFINSAGAANREMMELFLKSGIDVDARGRNGETALMLASVSDDRTIQQFLMDRGANVNAVTVDGYTALMFTASKGDREAAGLLIKRGADVNAKNSNGETALMLAVLNDRIEMAGLLIENGADLHAKNNKGATALQYAFLNTRMLELLRSAEAGKKEKGKP